MLKADPVLKSAPEIQPEIDSEKQDNRLHAILTKIDDLLTIGEDATHIAAGYYLATSFRRITFRGLINLLPTLNKVRNLTGMVTNAEGRAVFSVLREGTERLGLIAIGIGAVDQVWEIRHSIVELAESDRPIIEKVGKSIPILSSIVARTAADLVLTSAHFAPWVAKNIFNQDMTYAYDQIAHAETVVKQVTDPNKIENAYVFLATNIFLPKPAY